VSDVRTKFDLVTAFDPSAVEVRRLNEDDREELDWQCALQMAKLHDLRERLAVDRRQLS
jgi:hypothetical protein